MLKTLRKFKCLECPLFALQIKAGDTYDQLKKCITINIVDFECTPLKQVHSCYHLTEDNQGHRLTDVLEVHFLELPKLFQEGVSIGEDEVIVQWMLFIDGRSKEVMEMLAQKNKNIGSAYDLLKIISKDEKARMAYEAREAELMDQRTRVKSALAKGEEIGIKKGKAEGKAELIQALLRGGMRLDQIASMAGMDMREVAEIQKERLGGGVDAG